MENGETPPGPQARRLTSGPLSSEQHRMWLLEEMGVGWPAYMVDYALRFHGDLDVDVLKRALEYVFQEHDVLRTRYRRTSEDIEQVVVQESLAFHERPFSVEGSASLKDELWDVARSVRRSLDDHEPNFIVQLLHCGPGDVIVLMSGPHISLDLDSLRVIRGDLCSAYETLARGGEVVPRQTRQYLDHAVEQVLGSEVELSEEYWCSQLDGLNRLALPTDFRRPPRWQGEGSSVTRRIPAMVAESLRFLGRQHGASAQMTFLAVYMIALARLSGQEDIAVGIPLSTRRSPGDDNVIGCFLETIVVRVNITPERTYAEVLEDVRDLVLEGMRHPYLPSDKVMERTGGRDPSTHPIYQALFGYDDPEISSPALNGIGVEELPGGSQAAKVDLYLRVGEDGDHGLSVTVGYPFSLFRKDTIEAFTDHLVQLTRSIARAPEAPLLEHARSATGGRDTRRKRSPETGPAAVRQTVTRGAAAHPDRVAFAEEGQEQIFFGDVEASSALLASRLASLGATPESVVAVRASKWSSATVMALAAMRAGLAFQLLGREDRAGTIAAAGIRIACVVTDLPEDGFAGESGAEVIRYTVGGPGPEGERYDGDDDPVGGGLAQVLAGEGDASSDSGASWVCLSALGLSTRVLHQARALGIGAEDRLLVQAPLTDAWALTTVLAALVSGGSVIASLGDVSTDQDRSGDFVRDQKPSLAYIRAAAPHWLPRAVPESCRAVDVEGEVLPTTVLRELQGRLPVDVRGAVSHAEGSVPVAFRALEEHVRTGRRVLDDDLSDGRVMVLDDFLLPTMVGEVGVLYVSGPSLARGFVGSPKLTAEHFLPDPFSAEPGARMYRTGLTGRRTADGALEVLGRCGRVVTVRGTSVDLGELEAALVEHPSVAGARVSAFPRDEGGLGLRAEVELIPEGTPVTSDEIRAFLTKSVAKSSVPEDIIVVGWDGADSALPAAPSEADSESGEAPEDDLGRMVAEVWAECLKVGDVGPETDFFWSGGHSLVAAQIATRLEQRFPGVHISPMSLFEAPTFGDFTEEVRALLGQIPAQGGSAGAGPAPEALGGGMPDSRAERPDQVPLSFAQRSLWFLNELNGGSTYNVPYAVRLTGGVDTEALRSAMADVIDRHESLRTVFPESDGEPRQKVLVGDAARLRIPVIESDEGDLGRKIALAASRGFDLQHELPLSARLYELGPREHVLLLVLHHIVCDGLSIAVLLRDLGQAYAARSAGRPPEWRTPAAQYIDYTLWQREFLGGSDNPESTLSRQLRFWRRTLSGAPDRLPLPFDHEPGSALDMPEGWHGFEVPGRLAETLHEVARAGRTSLLTVLQAGVAGLLSRMGAGTDIPLGYVDGRREGTRWDDTVGHFVRTLVLRADVSDDPTFQELIARLRSARLAAYDNQDVPFELLVEEMGVKRDFGRNPLFQVFVGLEEDGELLPDLVRLAASRVDIADGTEEAPEPEAKFDLSFTFHTSGTPGSALRGGIAYRSDLFERSTVERMVRFFLVLLESFTSAPERKMGEVSLSQNGRA